MDTGEIARKQKRIVSQGAQQIELAIILRRLEVGTIEKLDWRTNLIQEERGITLFLLFPTNTLITS